MTAVGVVIPVGPGRQENVTAVLKSLADQSDVPAAAVVVEDGEALDDWVVNDLPFPARQVRYPRHEPGRRQPRNAGVRELPLGITHVWFLDSDVIVAPDALQRLLEAIAEDPQPRILVAPYDWLGAGDRSPQPDLRNDPRWASFHRYPSSEVRVDDLSAGLACFSGNLVWPVAEFKRVGGFWDDLHHGRCEDGELGLRAVAMGVPISFVAGARGWHLDHPTNTALKLERNQRDVPMLNQRHPWVQGRGVFLSDRDGKAFDVTCPKCGEVVHTIGWWAHAEECGVEPAL